MEQSVRERNREDGSRESERYLSIFYLLFWLPCTRCLSTFRIPSTVKMDARKELAEIYAGKSFQSREGNRVRNREAAL